MSSWYTKHADRSRHQDSSPSKQQGRSFNTGIFCASSLPHWFAKVSLLTKQKVLRSLHPSQLLAHNCVDCPGAPGALRLIPATSAFRFGHQTRQKQERKRDKEREREKQKQGQQVSVYMNKQLQKYLHVHTQTREACRASCSQHLPRPLIVAIFMVDTVFPPGFSGKNTRHRHDSKP